MGKKKFDRVRTFGFENALRAMRMAVYNGEAAPEDGDSKFEHGIMRSLGDDDSWVAGSLIAADDRKGCGCSLSKFLRMIHVQAEVTAPLWWWREVEFHGGVIMEYADIEDDLMGTRITLDSFDMENFKNFKVQLEASNPFAMFGFEVSESGAKVKRENFRNSNFWADFVTYLEMIRSSCASKSEHYEKRKSSLGELVRLLPESWLQTRMIDCDYATLRDIYMRNKDDNRFMWEVFCAWVNDLKAHHFITKEYDCDED